MKTLEEIIKTEAVFLHNWEDKESVINDFENLGWEKEEKKSEILKRYEGKNILFASYGLGNYSGDAFVLFEENGKLFEINAGHCSCYGLEDQWTPEEVCLPELEQRLTKGTFGTDSYSDNNFKAELIQFLGIKI